MDTKEFNDSNTTSFRNFTSYRFKEGFHAKQTSPYTVGIYTHTSGIEAVATTYDYKRRNAHYRALKRDAEVLQLVTEKQARRRVVNVRVPRLLTVIDKANRIIVIREFVKGVLLTRVSQGAKVAAYTEASQEFVKVGQNLTAEEAQQIPHVTRRDMKRTLLFGLLKGVYKDRWMLPQLIKLAYLFYRYAPSGKSTPELAVRSLRADTLVCEPDYVCVTDVRCIAFAEPGTDAALFPQLYFKEVGNETMRQYLDTQFDTVAAKRNFLYLAAYYAISSTDMEYIPVLAGTIAPYIEACMNTKAPARNLSMAVQTKSS